MELNDDVIVACMDLVGRTGARDFQMGYLNDGPDWSESPEWYAEASFQGAKLTSGTHPSPDLAAMALALRLLRGAVCRCGQQITLSDTPSEPRCRWRLVGARWEPGCHAPSVPVRAQRGDYAAIVAAMRERMEEGK